MERKLPQSDWTRYPLFFMGISILHVLHAFRPGGMENMVAHMAWHLSRLGHAVDICALTEADDFKTRLPQETHVTELGKSSGLDVGCVLRLRSLVRDKRPDVVHSHNWNGLIYSVAALAGLNQHLVHGEHALLYGWERSPSRLRLRKLLYSRCDVVHAVSKGQQAELQSLGLADRVDLRVVRNGVDTLKFIPRDKRDARLRLGIPADGVCIGMAARCVPEKQHSLLLQAFETLATRFPQMTLVLAGAGGPCEQDVLKRVSAHPFASRIFWLGHRNDMPEVYPALDMLVLPSTSEGMSNVTLEAMSCGVPVLMHHSCGSEELVRDGENGGLSAMNTPDEVVAAVTRMTSDHDLLLRMGLEARCGAEAGYPLEKAAELYTEIYRGLVGKP